MTQTAYLRFPTLHADTITFVTDEGDGRTWLATPDYQRVAAFKKPAVDPNPSLSTFGPIPDLIGR